MTDPVEETQKCTDGIGSWMFFVQNPSLITLRAVCGFVCLWVCYHDNSKLRASIFTKLGL